MNSYPGHVWDIPPPPGTAEEITNNYVQSKQDQNVQYSSRSRSPYRYSSSSRNRSSHRYSPHRYRTRRRSRSRSRDRRWRRSRSRSVSRGRRNRSRSVSRNRSHSNRSRSRSRKRYSRSRSPRRSVTSSSHSPDSNMSLAKSDNETDNDSGSDEAVRSAQEYAARALAAVASSFNKSTTSSQSAVSPDIPFKNDGSFLEMFKRMQEEQRAQEGEPQVDSSTSSRPAPSASIVGKRRGGRILKTGIVEKKRTNLAEDEPPKDAWSVYMKEVRRYKEACCDDDSKTRPLVK